MDDGPKEGAVGDDGEIGWGRSRRWEDPGGGCGCFGALLVDDHFGAVESGGDEDATGDAVEAGTGAEPQRAEPSEQVGGRQRPTSGNPKILSSAAPESADAPARLRLKATPMLIGLETALPFRCRWKSHPAALMPATQSAARASGSAGSRSATGATDVTVVSEDPHAASTEHSNTSNPSTLVTAIGRYSRVQSSRGRWQSLMGRIPGGLYASVPSSECPLRRGQRNWRSQLQTGRMWPRPNCRVT